MPTSGRRRQVTGNFLFRPRRAIALQVRLQRKDVRHRRDECEITEQAHHSRVYERAVLLGLRLTVDTRDSTGRREQEQDEVRLESSFSI